MLVDGDVTWFGCGLKLCALQAGDLKVLDEQNGLPSVPLVAVLKDHAGNLWVRARNSGVLEWPHGEARFRRPDTPVPGSALTGTPALDRDGRILLGTADGLLIGDDKGWQVIDRRVGLRGGVFAALEDRQHTLWMGTGGRGLTAWRGYREWESYSSGSGLPSDNVYEMLPQGDGAAWAGTEAGLVRGEPRGFSMTWKTVPQTIGVPVHSLQMDPSGDLWIGTASRGVARLHVRTGVVDWFGEKQGLTGKLAFTIRFDRQHQLWAATDSGLFLAAPPYKQFARVTDLQASWFWTVTEGADGTIWAGGADGLYALVSERWHHWVQADGLSNQEVVSIGPDPNGSVWVGYRHGGGIDRIQLPPRGSVSAGSLTSAATLYKGAQRSGSDGLIYFLSFDGAGRLWAGTEHGVDVWDGAHWGHYDTTDGLIWDDCDIGGFATGPDGALWFGTAGGLSRFKPDREKSEASDPAVLFTDVRMGAADILAERNPSFANSSGTFTAKFAAPNAQRDRSLAFRYRLDGNSPWTETIQRQVQFARLAPGTYRLEVQVRDRLGVWSPQAATFAFGIRTPWYRREWFIALLVLVPIIGLSAAFRLRTIRARQRELELQHIVDEKTSDLRQANEELLRLSTLDPLTGLANRRRFDQTLAQECARLRRSNSGLSLILVDVDHFKALNDSAGHQKGDEYLIIVARELARVARRTIDLAARIGGEEFALLLPATNIAEAARIAESLRLEIQELKLPHPGSSAASILTVSAGVATASGERLGSTDELVAAADRALYQAKSFGRNRIQVAS